MPAGSWPRPDDHGDSETRFRAAPRRPPRSTGPEDELKELADTFDEMLERLDAAFASQKRFVANAAHELRTPLTAMRTTIEVTLSKPARTPEQLETMAARVRRSLERAETTIDALLTLAISERGAATHEPVDLATAAEDALDAASASDRRARAHRAGHARSRPDQRGSRPARAHDRQPRRQRRPPQRSRRLDQRAHGRVQPHFVLRGGEHRAVRPRGGYPQSGGTVRRAEGRSSPAEGVGLGLSIASAICTAHGTNLVARSRPEGGLDVSIALPDSGSGADGADGQPSLVPPGATEAG